MIKKNGVMFTRVKVILMRQFSILFVEFENVKEEIFSLFCLFTVLLSDEDCVVSFVSVVRTLVCLVKTLTSMILPWI